MIEYVLAIDLGGTNIRVGIVDSNFKILHVLKERSIHNDASSLINQIINMINSLPYKDYDIEAIGVSSCGFIDNITIKQLFNLGISELELGKYLHLNFPTFPIYIVNDANAAALYEAYNQKRINDESILFLTISSGIGGGFVYQHKLIDLPFEVGHMLIEYQNKHYEVEHILSGNGLVKFCALNDYEIKDASFFFEEVKNNNQKAKEILSQYTYLLAIFISNLHLLLNTDTIVLSGGMMKSSSLFIDELKNNLDTLLKPYPLKKINLVYADHDQDAGLVGAAAVGFYYDK